MLSSNEKTEMLHKVTKAVLKADEKMHEIGEIFASEGWEPAMLICYLENYIVTAKKVYYEGISQNDEPKEVK